MNKYQAEKIINDYGGMIADTPEGDLVRDVFSLPYSPGRIRYAFFVYTEALIKEGLFNDEIENNLSMTYASLETRFVENPDKVNKAKRLYTKSEKAREYLDSRGGLTAFMPSVEKMTEYHNFVADCYGNWQKTG
ncbi:hypothetical protein COU14_02015 [Candidatus Kaiserbacteria bacterium CG10_big_fil_rev_8_21_14_0_10_44_10]|uniref:Uncharacterized protein n=1 Tax=Candidatus Kaiserbacteria bacterium CG10_big_fil_rev_8_21_14_0_10_44_10 TaxID=1974606 RepID=A0A2H0UHK4_9BACT|nr:MAG: hypothetical protein COU14_02015 [Candidatus Kaiserbacteria bacterium CG10_big_fil_rev_8_21_14_0_10_44_10]